MWFKVPVGVVGAGCSSVEGSAAATTAEAVPSAGRDEARSGDENAVCLRSSCCKATSSGLVGASRVGMSVVVVCCMCSCSHDGGGDGSSSTSGERRMLNIR